MKRYHIDHKCSIEFLKAQYLGHYFSQFTCYPWEISSGNMGLAFNVMLITSQPSETHQIEKLMECTVDIKNWMTNNVLLLNSEKKTELLIIGHKTPTSNNLEHCKTL